MSKKRDPVLPVLTYFETADLPLAEQALALSQSIVRRRKSVAAQRPATGGSKKKTAVAPAPASETAV